MANIGPVGPNLRHSNIADSLSTAANVRFGVASFKSRMTLVSLKQI